VSEFTFHIYFCLKAPCSQDNQSHFFFFSSSFFSFTVLRGHGYRISGYRYVLNMAQRMKIFFAKNIEISNFDLGTQQKTEVIIKLLPLTEERSDNSHNCLCIMHRILDVVLLLRFLVGSLCSHYFYYVSATYYCTSIR
jgi:hypothetical protein